MNKLAHIAIKNVNYIEITCQPQLNLHSLQNSENRNLFISFVFPCII